MLWDSNSEHHTLQKVSSSKHSTLMKVSKGLKLSLWICFTFFCQGHFGLSSNEELEMAIDNCKEMIGKAQPHSDRMKNLVQKLIQLRLKLQELKVVISKIYTQHLSRTQNVKSGMRVKKSTILTYYLRPLQRTLHSEV